MKWVEAGVQVPNVWIFTRLVSRDLVRWRLLTCFFPFFPDLWIHHPCPCCTYLAEEQKVTAWHLCACDIIRMLIWQYTNYDSWQSDTGKHFALPVEVTWPFSRTPRRLRICPTPPRCLLSPFFFFPTRLLHLELNAGWWTFGCLASAVVIYCLLDRAMNSDPKWNSYCYQKHKIPITLDVRAEKRKWSRYS